MWIWSPSKSIVFVETEYWLAPAGMQPMIGETELLLSTIWTAAMTV